MPVLTRGGRLSNPGQHGGREHPTRDAGIPCMHAHWEQKGPLGPGSRTCKVDFTPAKNVCRGFFGPSLDLRGRFQTHQTHVAGIFVDPCLCSAGFDSNPACLHRACRTPPRSTWRRLTSLHKADKCPPSRHTTPDVHTTPGEPSIQTG